MHTLSQIAKSHCRAAAPPLSLDAFVLDHYGITSRHLRLVSAGKRRLSTDLLARLSQSHARLFPGEVITLHHSSGVTFLLGAHAPPSSDICPNHQTTTIP